MSTLAGTTDKRIPHLQKFGWQSMAYSSLQEGMEYFLDEHLGYVAYSPIKNKENTPVCLGDPICHKEESGKLLDKFLSEFSDPIFMHIRPETGKILEQRGFYINEIGVETVIDCQKFTTTGKSKETLRAQRNKAIKDGLTVGELDLTQVAEEELRYISNEWMTKKATHDNEMGFLVRPAVYGDELDVRKFFAFKDWQIQGFVFYDPIYENGEVVGYLANTLRTLGRRSYSVTDFINVEAIDRFKEEGIKYLSLGYSPFHLIDDSNEFNHSKPLKELFKYTYQKCNYMYAFQNLAFHKDRYRPGVENTQQIKLYCATKHKLPILCLYEVFHKMGMHPITQTKEYAMECMDKVIKGLPGEAKKLVTLWK